MVVTAFQTFLVLDDLDNVEEYWSLICRLSLYWQLSKIFLIIRLRL